MVSTSKEKFKVNSTDKFKADRLFPINLMKAISIVAIVSFHSNFVPESAYLSVAPIMEIIFAPLRVSVAILFTISFFLLRRSLQKDNTDSIYGLLKKRFVRLAIPTIFWFSIATSLRLLSKAAQTKPLLTTLIQGSIFPGAYYLLILLQLIVVFVYIHNWFSNTKNVVTTVFLQVITFAIIWSVIAGGWGEDIVVVLKFIARSFIAYWYVYMALGAYFFNNWSKLVAFSSSISQKRKTILLLVTTVLMLGEYSCLYLVAKGQTLPFEYAMISCILGVSVIFVCFASVQEDQLAEPFRKTIELLSKYSLGIFCINGILSLIFQYLGSQIFIGNTFGFLEVFSIKLVSWFLLFSISLYLSVLLDRLGLGICVR
jgi:hypothetical protein